MQDMPKRSRYNTVFSSGTNVRIRPFGGLELGLGGQYWFEPEVVGNRMLLMQHPN